MDISKELIKYINKILKSTEDYYINILKRINVDVVFALGKGIEIDDSFEIHWTVGNPGYYETDSGPAYPSIDFRVDYSDPFKGTFPRNTINNKTVVFITWSFNETDKQHHFQLPYDENLLRKFDELVNEFYIFFENILEDFVHVINNPDEYGNYYSSLKGD